MNRQLLCTWLGVAEQDWPPNHHALLGLPPEIDDPATIEQSVQERLAQLRSYQLSYPEEATEGMNRLAQAYICLTEKLARKQTSAAVIAVTVAPAVSDETFVSSSKVETKVDWNATTGPNPQLPAPTAAPATTSEPDTIDETAWRCREAQCGLGTLRKVIHRIDRTRQLLHDWKKAGHYLGNPRRRLTKMAAEKDLERRLNRIFEEIHDFPGFVGQPGRPGYRVVAMARLEMTSLMFKGLDPQQREHLARDWQAGYDVLVAHRRFLRQRFKTMRREGLLRKGLRALRALVNDHPVTSAVSVGLFFSLGYGLYLALLQR